MKIQALKLLMSMDGKTPIQHHDGTQASLRSIISEIMATRLNEDPKELKHSLKCFDIANAVYASDNPDISVPDLGFVLDRAVKIGYNHFVIGRLNELIESSKSVRAVPDSGE